MKCVWKGLIDKIINVVSMYGLLFNDKSHKPELVLTKVHDAMWHQQATLR